MVFDEDKLTFNKLATPARGAKQWRSSGGCVAKIQNLLQLSVFTTEEATSPILSQAAYTHSALLPVNAGCCRSSLHRSRTFPCSFCSFSATSLAEPTIWSGRRCCIRIFIHFLSADNSALLREIDSDRSCPVRARARRYPEAVPIFCFFLCLCDCDHITHIDFRFFHECGRLEVVFVCIQNFLAQLSVEELREG